MRPMGPRSLSACCRTAVLLLGLCALPGAPAFASIGITPMSCTIGSAGHRIAQIKIHSDAKETTYVRIVVKRVDAPGTDQEQHVEMLAGDFNGLLASPQKLVMPAGASRVVRLMHSVIPAKETVYRVFAEPVKADGPDNARETEGTTSRVNIAVIWAAVVFVKPQATSARLSFDATSRACRNDGTEKVQVTRVGYCPASDDESSVACRWWRTARNVFPDQVLSLPPYDDVKPTVHIEYKLDGAPLSRQVWPG